jgi:hypothetical protein
LAAYKFWKTYDRKSPLQQQYCIIIINFIQRFLATNLTQHMLHYQGGRPTIATWHSLYLQAQTDDKRRMDINIAAQCYTLTWKLLTTPLSYLCHTPSPN